MERGVPELTVIIPTFDRVELFERTLKSLAECELPGRYSRLIVVENGRKSGAEQVVRQADARLKAEYRYHAEANKSAALNSVLSELADELVVFFDDDVRIHPKTLVAYSSAAERHSNVFFGGPTAADFECSPEPWIWLPPSVCGYSNGYDAYGNRSGFLGFNWAAWARHLRECGGFNPNVGPGAASGARGQESDMQRRLAERGIEPVFVPDAMVWHYVPKERCTPEWSLKRVYETAKSSGMKYRGTSQRIFGYPRWSFKDAGLKYLRAMWVSLYRKREDRYRAWYDYYMSRGYMEGTRWAFGRRPDEDIQ